jgi:hypothetical protein
MPANQASQKSSNKPGKRSAKRFTTKASGKRRWSAAVKTTSTYPPEGLFTKSAATIARSLASKEVSPKGPGSGMRMLNFYINRAGHNLSAERRRELQKAKELLSQCIARDKKR